MKRNTLNFVIDLVSAVVMLGLIGTGLIMRFVLPPGSGRGRLLWTMDRHGWGDVHFWMAVAAGVLMLVHVALHWQWVCTTVSRMIRPRGSGAGLGLLGRNAAGAITVLLLVGLFAGFVWIARGQVYTDDGGERGPAREHGAESDHPADDDHAESRIRGSMTLTEAAAALEISVDELRQRIKAPTDVTNDQRLGGLSRRMGVPMTELRRLAEGK